MTLLDGDALRGYLGELGDELKRRGIRADLFVVGGAAMALAYNTRRATRDIHAVFEPKATVYEAARRVATRHPDDLGEGWLNDSVKGFMLGADPDATVAFQHPGVTVRVASPRYLFAMKVAAARVEQDDDDVAALYRLSGFTSAEEAFDFLGATYPKLRLLPKAQYLVEAIAAAES